MKIWPVIFERLRSELKLKLALLVALNLWVYVPYYLLQRHHFFAPTTMPEGSLDRLIPFFDQAVWIYLSMDLLMPLGPFLMGNRRQLWRYAAGMALIGAVADLVFIFWPTQCVRPDPTGTSALYRLVIAMDAPSHACPSLHAAFTIFSTLCAMQVARELRARLIWKIALWFWAMLILLATLLTKQHVVADLVAGSALAVASYFYVFYRPASKWKNEGAINTNPITANQTSQTNPTMP